MSGRAEFTRMREGDNDEHRRSRELPSELALELEGVL